MGEVFIREQREDVEYIGECTSRRSIGHSVIRQDGRNITEALHLALGCGQMMFRTRIHERRFRDIRRRCVITKLKGHEA